MMGDTSLQHEERQRSYDLRTGFACSAAALTAALITLFACLVEYPQASTANSQQLAQYYMWYIHVALMVFIGFGFLMTFLKTYSYSAVGFNYLYSCFVTLTAIICIGAAEQIVGVAGSKTKIELTMPLLIDSLFCAAAGMISFGAVIGKTSPLQTLWLLVFEVPLYAVNVRIAQLLGVLDVGGSITIHAFGAYFGLAASVVLSRKPGSGSGHRKNKGTRMSDMTAMIGTLFLFIFWPSFVGALAVDTENETSSAQFFSVVNTILAIFGSCCSAFVTSAVSHGKLDMVHIQNSTLAGGVAIGAAANLRLAPGGALAVGVVAGIVSTEGYAKLQPMLEESWLGLRDTCGVHNLHGIPGLLGGFVAAFAAIASSNEGMRNFSSAGTQFWHQVVVMLITVGIASVGGASIATVLRLLEGSERSKLQVEHMYDDAVFWKEEEKTVHIPVETTSSEEV